MGLKPVSLPGTQHVMVLKMILLVVCMHGLCTGVHPKGALTGSAVAGYQACVA